jgi:hypothetical protein
MSMEKPILYWLDQLPEPYRTAAIELLDQDCIADNLLNAIDRLKMWSSSAEGHDFWADVKSAIFHERPLPRYPYNVKTARVGDLVECEGKALYVISVEDEYLVTHMNDYCYDECTLISRKTTTPPYVDRPDEITLPSGKKINSLTDEDVQGAPLGILARQIADLTKRVEELETERIEVLKPEGLFKYPLGYIDEDEWKIVGRCYDMIEGQRKYLLANAHGEWVFCPENEIEPCDQSPNRDFDVPGIEWFQTKPNQTNEH